MPFLSLTAKAHLDLIGCGLEVESIGAQSLSSYKSGQSGEGVIPLGVAA